MIRYTLGFDAFEKELALGINLFDGRHDENDKVCDEGKLEEARQLTTINKHEIQLLLEAITLVVRSVVA